MSFPHQTDPRLLAAVQAAGLDADPMLGGVLLATNAHHVTLDTEGRLLVYDNNGRFVRDAFLQIAPEGAALAAALRAIASRARMLPQVTIGFR